ncbi:hypothetical protein [Streptomyces alanosinicus]|uniref:Uncharacterized protein n=1 Tax=Streptomyces alanosinicus TaxID=68171 RepID=A0A918YIH6_9ACTN|nr:hypothetical protein [Streptomyces alanosinicus]GHE04227.1 hypothetical protein GCM10010339_34730 [Streptomyces alanosinicus]
MSPIRAQSGTDDDTAGAPSAVRRGRHRKPRPRKVLLATGGLALAAGVLSLVRVASDPGVGAPATAEAEPRIATPTHTPTAPPSATSAMGGRTPAPTPPRRTTAPPPPPTTHPTPSPLLPTTPTTTRPHTTTPPPTTTHPKPPTTPPPTQPTPTPPQTDPGDPGDQGDVCVPVLGLCVNSPETTDHRHHHR